MCKYLYIYVCVCLYVCYIYIYAFVAVGQLEACTCCSGVCGGSGNCKGGGIATVVAAVVVTVIVGGALVELASLNCCGPYFRLSWGALLFAIHFLGMLLLFLLLFTRGPDHRVRFEKELI